MTSSWRVVLITAPRGKKAEALAKGLVEARLAGCVNVMPSIVSHYRWEGRLRRDAESLLLVKTSSAKLSALERWISAHHPYSVPEMIALPVVAGSKPYLGWLAGLLK